MIVFRYLAREVLFSMTAVSAVLLMFTLSARFVKYLADAAAGKLASDVLFAVMGYRLPGFLELILPLGLFLAILFAYGRLYMDSEMTVLSACGMSQRRLLGYSLIPALGVAMVVAGFSLFVSPLGAERAEAILSEQRKRTEFDALTPARFEAMRNGQSITYAESLSSDRKQMFGVFMAQMADGSASADLAVIVAESGNQITHEENGQRYLILKNGHRYEGRPGEADYRITRFAQFAQRLEQPHAREKRKAKADSTPTRALLGSDKLVDQATLQWRLSIPVLVVILTLMAVPLSKTSPRQGRYLKMIPAILLYIIYLVSLSSARGAIEDGRLPVHFGLWAVHSIFFVIALLLLTAGSWRSWLRRRPALQAQGGEGSDA
ncbi:LPS export ABC transporter permease LptF [Exilibacterium tricleocarpae]|uniref:Lipopolysaccharide export system permease protein LptF n=1 Tax=Exilibacterium tricleocarpae TaxID=2591008 RepID=A0A545U870_9GAMM|nr:LPS export ABC transporter permease LptF [Exilibacterium tricleocarpae]TQV85672.1 LPS export ABC transporter permease LptF [Exilibacterium tricleocarpae]